MAHVGSAERSKRDSVRVVEEFWAAVWKARDPEAIDRFVADDFVLTTGGVDVVSKAAFRGWAARFMRTITDLEFEAVETFRSEDGSRVASRWRLTGKYNGPFGSAAEQRPITLTGTAVWTVREDGKLLHDRVERSSWELFQRLSEEQPPVFGVEHGPLSRPPGRGPSPSEAACHPSMAFNASRSASYSSQHSAQIDR